MIIMDNLANKIASKIYEKYDLLGKSGKPIEDCEWTLLAGFLVDKDDYIEVVSIATGTKCIGSKSMCPNGLVLNDSHAEVLARRAFLRYLYSEVIRVKERGESFIFSRLSSEGKCILRDSIKFYFFTSHVPCGDACIIPMKNDAESMSLKKGLKRRFEEIDCENIGSVISDIHRTGAKPVSGEERRDPHGVGELYHIKGAVRTKPGRGDPTLSVSCSDKIAKWIFVGVQGALLSQLIANSLRISVIIIGGGGQFSKDVLEEALIKRSGTTYHPIIFQSNLVFKHSAVATGTSRPSPNSIIWANIGQERAEVSVNGKRLGCTKKSKGKTHLLVCKRELFKHFLSIKGLNNLNLTYRQAKDMAVDYQNQFKIFKQALGAWTERKEGTQLFKLLKEELITGKI